mmetsp:Transcript_25842/g.48886  ORF Transcript_25842/g.48886 Transcript_25842/m.48886 type:complete len:239 (+) Transcript_25842:801-1517(+)
MLQSKNLDLTRGLAGRSVHWRTKETHSFRETKSTAISTNLSNTFTDVVEYSLSLSPRLGCATVASWLSLGAASATVPRPIPRLPFHRAGWRSASSASSSSSSSSVSASPRSSSSWWSSTPKYSSSLSSSSRQKLDTAVSKARRLLARTRRNSSSSGGSACHIMSEARLTWRRLSTSLDRCATFCFVRGRRGGPSTSAARARSRLSATDGWGSTKTTSPVNTLLATHVGFTSTSARMKP